RLLAALIFCEAGNQPYEGQVAVGAVVMNRVNSVAYPGSIREVIYQSGQFGPAMTGWLDQVLANGSYTQTALQAAADALAGGDPEEGCLLVGRGDYGIRIRDHYYHQIVRHTKGLRNSAQLRGRRSLFPLVRHLRLACTGCVRLNRGQ